MSDPQTVATEMSKPETFNFLERLQGRGMPEEDVTIYLNEKLGWDLLRLEEKHANARKNADAVEIEAKIKRVKAQLADSAYIFTLRGMTNERYDELVDQAFEQHPQEYEEVVNPLTGVKNKVEIPNDERDALFNTLLLAETIVKITDPDGAVDENITDAYAANLKKFAPLDAIRRITELATRMRMAAQWMDAVQDEDFSPRL